jgi:hypothetical protein
MTGPRQGAEDVGEETSPPLPRRSRSRVLMITVLTVAMLVAFAELLPAKLGLIAVAAALVAGVGLERYRQYRRPIPPPLGDTPRDWMDLVAEEIGLPYALGALLLAAAAAGILFASVHSRHTTTATVLPPTPENAGPQPRIAVRKEAEGPEFTIKGAAFRVLPGGASGGGQVESQSPGAGFRWVTVAVEARNTDRKAFDPALLAYRLLGPNAGLIFPDRHGATGPAGLTLNGTLTKGETAVVQLAFRVPEDETKLTLIFEPVSNGPEQVRVALTPGSG